MIALDTNILLRLFIEDNPKQSAAARDMVTGCSVEQPAYVPREVLVEFLWMIQRSYDTPRKGVIEVMENLMSLPGIRFEDEATVGAAFADYRAGEADFPDLMVLAASRAAGCKTLCTFDRTLARHVGVTLLEVP